MWRTGSVVFLILALAGAAVWLMMQQPSESNAQTGRKRTEFGEDRAPVMIKFDAKQAIQYLNDVCDIGPRISGSEGMAKQQDLLTKHFTKLGAKVELQKFTAVANSRPREKVEMANMIVTWHPDRERRVILCSHYDTRPLADQEEDRRKWTKPFVSANDGGSGVALLMELGRHMKDIDPDVGVDFVFFDGEEYVFEKQDRYFLGSEHFGSTWKKAKTKPKYLSAILLDMVGGKTISFPIEPHSYYWASDVVKEVWDIARDLKCDAFSWTEGTAVEDDHVALNRNGIRAIDIIDFSYKHWHRLSDTPENCSGESLEQVAKVLAVWLKRQK